MKMRGSTSDQCVTEKIRRVFKGFRVSDLLRPGVGVTLIALMVSGCASFSQSQKPQAPRTTTASLTNDPYPDLRQLPPEEAKRERNRRALVNELRASAPEQGRAPAVQPQQLVATNQQQGSGAPQTAITDQNPTDSVTPRQTAQPPQQVAQAQPQTDTPAPPANAQNAPPATVLTPQPAPQEPPPAAAKKSGFWNWLGPISAGRSSEETPAQKLRRSRRFLTRQSVDTTNIENDQGSAAVVAGTPVVEKPAVNRPVVKREKQGPEFKPNRTPTQLRPSLAKPKPVVRSAEPVRQARSKRVVLPKARAVPREPVQVSRIGSQRETINRRSAQPPARTAVRSRPGAPANAGAAAKNAPPLSTPQTPARNVTANLPGRSSPVTVYFSKDSAALTASFSSRLRRIAGLQKQAGRRIHVRAVAASGANGERANDSDALNQLAVSRARAVAAKLISFGVKPADLVLQARQERTAGAGRSTLQSSRSRRAEIYIE